MSTDDIDKNTGCCHANDDTINAGQIVFPAEITPHFVVCPKHKQAHNTAKDADRNGNNHDVLRNAVIP